MKQYTIKSNNLKASDLPRREATWQRIIQFASTFDPKIESPHGSKVTGVKDISEASSIVDRRTALYVEWRRYNHFLSEPDSLVMQKIHSTIECLRSKLPN